MAKSIIIVEHDNDKFVFEAIIRFMQRETEIGVESAENTDIEWLIKNAESSIEQPTGLKEAILGTFNDIVAGRCDKLGIIWDLDDLGVENRIAQFNNAIEFAKDAYKKEVIISQPLSKINEFITLTIDGVEIQLACHFIHIDGKGEIENVLKAIATKPAPLADCVDAHLPKCLKINNEKELREKDLVKLWINHYQRYDTLTKKNRTEAYTKTENVMKNRTEIYDFGREDVKELTELKQFLNLFI